LQEKAQKFNQDKEIQEILSELNAEDPEMAPYFGKYSSEKAKALKSIDFDRVKIAERGLKYERLDQLTIDLILGYR